MNNKTLKVLEFDKIREHISSLAYSKMACDKILEIVPVNDIDEINKRLKETSSARDMITNNSYPSFSDLSDMTEVFERIDVDALLSIPEILKVLRLLECTSSVKQYYNESSLKETYIEKFFVNLITLIDFQNEIRRCILSEDEIADDASIELRNIRRQIKGLEGRIKEKLNEMISSQNYKSLLQEGVITQKNNRYCLPVKVECKTQLKGIIHEESASGQTVFIEPIQVVEISNKIKEFEDKEQKEIERILYSLTYEISQNIDTIKNNYNLLIILDTIFAKGKYSKEIDGICPKINTNKKYINLKLARHPLIDKEKVVPINVEIGKKYSSLIITGPNTGGKTVTLKTIGLLTLMAQAGLHIPAYDDSEISIFDEVYADIGDEQSIEQSLSTFSSHMKNIVEITSKVNENTLVLIDEIGAGTDPVEGAALAISILKYLKDKKAMIVATTHYSELKHYALVEEDTINASCEFDINSLMPTYRLLIGIPGKSNAFEISQKMGLNKEIIDNAKENINKGNISFEDAIKAASDEKERAEKEADLAKAYKEEIEIEKKDYEKRLQKLKEEKEKVLNDARREALKIVEEAKENTKNLLDGIKKKAKEINETLNAKEMSTLSASLESSSKELEEKMRLEKEATYKVNPEKIKLKKGMEVYISSLDKNGIIKDIISDTEALVEVGIMKVKVFTKYIFDISKKEKEKNNALNKNKKSAVKTTNLKIGKMTSGFELNVIGLYPSEALGKVEKFIDDAVLMNIEQIRIVHGKGTGILRKEIHEALKNNPQVDSFRLGEFGEGDAGVTIVKLK